MQKAGIIGGAGFIGSYVTRKFLEKGYAVKASATNITNEDKYQHLKALPGSENLEIVPLNVLDANVLRTFVQDCSIVVHGGTPFQLDVQDPRKELLEPTIKGTENFLKVMESAASVKNVVIIASVAAYNAAFPMPAPGRAADHVFTEVDTPYCDENCHPYAQAKFYANQAVRKFLLGHPDLSIQVVTVSPTFVVGPPLSAREDSTSAGMQYLFKNKIAPNPFLEQIYQNDVEWAMVDVEDVAACVFSAATTGGIHGKNYILSSESWKTSDVSRLLNRQSPIGSPRIVYSSALATRDLGVKFASPQIPLGKFG